jgi:hypothetical protein
MAARNEFAYDEDDYVPSGCTPQKPGTGRNRAVAIAAIVALTLAVLVVVYVMRSRVRMRDAEIMQVRAEQDAMIEARRAGVARPARDSVAEDVLLSAGWTRLQGTWSRTPRPDEAIGYPIRFEFHAGRSATVTHADNQSIEVSIRICRESAEMIELDAQSVGHNPRLEAGLYHGEYRFTFQADDSILLDDRAGGLVFTRRDVPENPARSRMPPY